jgi:plasmid maintenance system antidote protein VapI
MLFTGGKIHLAGDMAIKLQYFVDKGGEMYLNLSMA